ncbi:hypothetical protein CDL12_27071 [Handroanthus impetiginosus]|uniref:Pectinesterase inhibitor domain-containing protein n=1 Tax=Handroanthus impetiginosus TaxID=429701 RepID=A0A2G9G527_9LAMI|nr:hypothetical protein CDL12_27071 [Handroanthus impetiginosus]
MKMPFAPFKTFIFFSIILSLLSFLKSDDLLISEICRKTRNPNLCSQILKSNNRARKASSPVQLGVISMDLSKSTAQATKNMIIMLRLRTIDREMRARYKSCVMNYESAIYYLKLANYYLKGGDFANAGRYTAAALNEPISCRKIFAVEPKDVKERNDRLECLCSVVLAICNNLYSGRN